MSEELKAAQARIAELEAWKAEEIQVMSPLMDYARGVCTGPLGCSLIDWLVQDHKRLSAELAAIKAQEPVLDAPYGGILRIETGVCGKPDNWVRINPCKLYTAPAAPAVDAQCDQLRAEADYYRFNLRNVLKDLRDDLARGGMAPSWKGVAETISMVLSHDRAALSTGEEGE